ncbi:MAG: hypothetical protein ABJA78_16155 [Ferruginibacter sp.]
MEWINIIKGSLSDVFELWHQGKKMLNLSFNKKTKTTRMESLSDRRVFFIQRGGFFHHKNIVIKNEYGIKIGEIENEKQQPDEGFIQVDDRKYYYVLTNERGAELKLYENETKENFIVSCNLSALTAGAVTKTSSLHDTSYPVLLTGLCWFLFHPQKGNTVEFAA